MFKILNYFAPPQDVNFCKISSVETLLLFLIVICFILNKPENTIKPNKTQQKLQEVILQQFFFL